MACVCDLDDDAPELLIIWLRRQECVLSSNAQGDAIVKHGTQKA